MKIAAHEKEAGIEHPNGFRAMPDPRTHVIEIPDNMSAYAEAAEKTGLFVTLGKTYGGFGPGKMKKNWIGPQDAAE